MATRNLQLAGMIVFLALSLAAGGYWFMSEPARAPAPLIQGAALEDPELAGPIPAFSGEANPWAESTEPESDLSAPAEESPAADAEAGDSGISGDGQRSPALPADDARMRVLSNLKNAEILRLEHDGLTLELADLAAQSQMLRLTLSAGREFKVSISGRVTDESGYGISGAEVHARRAAPAAARNAGQHTFVLGAGRAPQSATTDDAGYFSATFTLRAPEDAETIDASVQARAKGYYLEAPVRVENLRENELRSGVALKMAQAGSITGRVVDQNRAPVAGAIVSLLDSVRVDQSGAMQVNRVSTNRVRTDAEGRYRLENVKPGAWNIRATRQRYSSGQTIQPVSVIVGQEAAAPDIRLSLAASVKVRLLKADGSPIGEGKPNGRLRVRIAYKFNGGQTVTRSAFCDAEGNARFDNVPEGAVEYSLIAPGFENAGPFPLAWRSTEIIEAGVVYMTSESR